MSGNPVHRDVMILDISEQGFFVDFGNEKLYATYEYFPWFADAEMEAFSAVELSGDDHVYWPELNIAISIASLRDPLAHPPIPTQPNKS